MGTSTSNRGQNGNTPLVPSWLDDDLNDMPQQDSKIPVDNEQYDDTQSFDSKRFTSPRSDFTRYINSGGNKTDRLHKAISSYVRKSAGGSQNATIRLGSARRSTAKLVSIMSGFAGGNISATANRFNLGDIIGKPAKEVFLRIMDFVCPDGGRTDEGIARSAYIDALSTIPDLENKQIESLSPSEFLAFTEIYMADVVQKKLLNDIANKMFSLPDNISTIENIENQMKEFIQNAISDSISRLNVDICNISQQQAQNVVDSIYNTTFDIMSSYEEE